jgi:hypothetical protein
MPVDEHILGFSNRWYPAAIETAQILDIAGLDVRVVTPALVIATKLEAFHGRGGNDIFASHDLEDIIAVVAFHRLSSVLAHEARGVPVTVMIACPARRRVTQVIPDPNASTWAENCDLRRPSAEDMLALARQVASLVDGHGASQRHAG